MRSNFFVFALPVSCDIKKVVCVVVLVFIRAMSDVKKNQRTPFTSLSWYIRSLLIFCIGNGGKERLCE